MYLLDTNVVSEMRKLRSGRAHPQVAAWAETVILSELYLSVVTLMELEIGVLQVERRDQVQGALLRKWLEQVAAVYEGRVLAIDATIAIRSARLQVPDPRPFHDSLIGATALTHGMLVVTRNVTDFEPLGVSLINPWAF